MGSSYDLRIAGYSVLSDKRYIPDEILGMFAETDRTTSPPSPESPHACGNVELEEGQAFVGYVSYAAALADRLDVLGFTAANARRDFEEIRSAALADSQLLVKIWEEQNSKPPHDETTRKIIASRNQEISLLRSVTFDTWLATMSTLVAEGLRWKDFSKEPYEYSRKLTATEHFILQTEHDRPILGYYCSDLRFLLRAFLLCCHRTSPVVLDISDVVAADYFEEETPLTFEARQRTAAIARSFEKTIVLTEGRTDARLLAQALHATFPHLSDYFSFLDYATFAVPGGASQLVALIKSLAGAGIANRIIGLFDNDTAGHLHLEQLRSLRLPENFRVLPLPYLESAESYPTIGPTGNTEMNINGLACSLELYLGANSLTDRTGSRAPVQWTSFERSVGRYQGEIIDKHEVQERFLAALAQGTAKLQDIRLVIEALIKAFNE